jgi:hypothetical protein
MSLTEIEFKTKEQAKEEIDRELYGIVYGVLVDRMHNKSYPRLSMIVFGPGYYDYIAMNHRRAKKYNYNYIVYIDIERPGEGKPLKAYVRFVDPKTWVGKPDIIEGNTWEVYEKVADFVSRLKPRPSRIEVLEHEFETVWRNTQH